MLSFAKIAYFYYFDYRLDLAVLFMENRVRERWNGKKRITSPLLRFRIGIQKKDYIVNLLYIKQLLKVSDWKITKITELYILTSFPEYQQAIGALGKNIFGTKLVYI